MRGMHGRGGPAADPNSERSAQRGLTYNMLPREGFTGRVPAFPLPKPSTREREIWRELWRTPQAAKWDVERFRMLSIGHYTRLLARCEAVDASAALFNAAQRYADQLGLTPGGMAFNRWRLNSDETSVKVAEPKPVQRAKKATPTRRLRVLPPLNEQRKNDG